MPKQTKQNTGGKGGGGNSTKSAMTKGKGNGGGKASRPTGSKTER